MTLDGFEKTRRVLASAPDVFKAYSADAVQASSFAVSQQARSLVREDTGALKSKIGYTVRGLSGRVGIEAGVAYGRNPQKYWRFVEFGRRLGNRPAHPFFRPAAERERLQFVQRMRQVGQRAERDLSAGRFL